MAAAESRRMYEARIESDERYRSLFSNMLNGLAYCRMLYDDTGAPVDFNYLDVNDSFERITGLRGVVGRKVSEVIPGIRTLSPELFEAYGRVASSRIPETFEFDFKSMGKWLNISVYSPEAGAFVAVFDDITERKHAEQKLLLFRSLLDRTNDMIQVVDPVTGRFLDVNEACCTQLGYSRDEMLALRVVDVDTTLGAAGFTRSIETLRRTGIFMRESVHRRKEGTLIPVEVSVSFVRAEREYCVAVVRDVSARMRLEAERALQVSALNSAADPIVITDRDGTIAWVNAAFTDCTGYSPDEAIGRNPRSLLRSGAHDKEYYGQMWDTILSGRVWQGEMTNRRKDGTLYPELQTITPVRNPVGEIAHFIAVKRDLTAEKKLQAQLLQAQKMESVGRLAGGVAHDFNNLLLVMNGWTEMAIADLPAEHAIRPSLEEVLHAGQGAAALTRQLLAFSRQQVVAPHVFSVNDLVTGLEKIVGRLLGEDVELVIEADPGAGLVKMDRGQLEQTLMNLAINARDAMPRGGTLLIKTSNVELPPGLELSHDDVPSGEYVILEVTDTGTGISDEIRAHMFEPFFTTKQAGKGRGLGLATCYGIVRQAGGFIDVSSVLGAGTTMKIQLPRTHEPLEAVSSRQRPTPRRGVETILLVEDSPAVSRVTARMLELRGYRVLLARHGDEALAMMTSESEPVHLLVTDVVLAGGMSGRELADRLRRLKPELKLLYVSGYTPDVTLTHGVLEHEAELLQKPFTAETLAARVREILDDG